ncbi:hypothetical protein WME76_28670 [Sorangium sp. So ce119]|uniref:hypothetical protein n=1 Tax=Sorangium sp. So ce119 TaxID=3133279 RepID=UPI003F625135
MAVRRLRALRRRAELRTTKWTWYTAAHGIGKLHTLTSPDGDKKYGYTRFAEVQDLDYGYDDLLNLTHRTDALQRRNTTERFRYDALQRLTCAYFSEAESASAPCAIRYDHAPDGNLTFTSDAGTLAYDDPSHPHAATGAALVTGSFGYDAVENQIARPGGTAVRYTPFDLPERITQGTSTVTFAYDGDQQVPQRSGGASHPELQRARTQPSLLQSGRGSA